MAKQTNEERAVIGPPRPRLPYPEGKWIYEKFGVDRSTWYVLVDAIFPAAKTAEAVVLALAYCKARGYDPMKKMCHIVPIWSSELRRNVETIWPSIAQARTDALRSNAYAGLRWEYGTKTVANFLCEDGFQKPPAEKPIQHFDWIRVHLSKFVKGVKCDFEGPAIWFHEYYGRNRDGIMNSMWEGKAISQHQKCAEAAALRAVFPEICGGEIFAEEVSPDQASSVIESQGMARIASVRAALTAEPEIRLDDLISREETVIEPEPVELQERQPARKPKQEQAKKSVEEFDLSPMHQQLLAITNPNDVAQIREEWMAKVPPNMQDEVNRVCDETVRDFYPK